MSDRTYNAGEVAAELTIHRHTVRNWLESGRIRGDRVGRDWQIPASEVERLRAELSRRLVNANAEMHAAKLFGEFVRGHESAARGELRYAAEALLAADDATFDARVAIMRKALEHWDMSHVLVAELRRVAGKIEQVQEELEDEREPSDGWAGDDADTRGPEVRARALAEQEERARDERARLAAAWKPKSE